MRTAFVAFLLSFAAILVAGCNTTRGLGQDVEATGEAIEEAAEETKEELSQ